jgi:4-cresol dehydrogenase (hydroxylating)
MSIDAFRKIEGIEVYDKDEATEKYHRNTIAAERRILGSLKATSVEQIQKIVHVATTHSIQIHAFSTGHDWGFGSSLPPSDGCVILDLSGMKRVIEFNAELGYATVEPGVTQQDLYDYMQAHGYNFMIPTTGGGPSCSLIGNALEKGYGITPYMDHWGGVMSLEAVLPNGALYRSAFAEFGATKVDPIYKWKLGPYLDGLFVQGNFGIITRATLALAKRPDIVGQFIAFIDEQHLEDAIRSTAEVARRYGSMIGGINLMNGRRVLSMVESKYTWKLKGYLPEEYLQTIARKKHVADWVVLIGVYSPLELQRAIGRGLRKEFQPYANRTVFLNRSRLRTLETLAKFIPNHNIKRTLLGIRKGLDALEGIPTEIALPLAFLKTPHTIPESNIHPDRDGAGLIWYNPIIPTDPALTRTFVTGVREIFFSERLEPLITLTAISERVIATNIPIVFNREDKEEVARAKSASKRMLRLAQSLGCFSDRIDIDTMRELYDSAEGTCFDLTDTIKKAIDPKGILSPGRYSRLRNTPERT